MNPAAVSLPYQLGKLDAPLLLHLYDEAEKAAVVGPVARNNIRRTSEDMVAVLHAAYQGVELLAAIPTADYDRLAPRLAYRV